MAETALATAYVKIVPSFKGFKEEFDRNIPNADPAGKKSGDQFSKGFGSSVGGGLKRAFVGVLAGGAVAGFTRDLIAAGEAEVSSNKKLENVAKSMGIFGNQTDKVTARLEALSSQQQMALGIDDDVIKSTQTKLLTFKNLAMTAGQAGGMFDRATIAAQDLAAAGFGSAETNAVQLGKALQDPIKGITALARSGVTFTDAEKKKIETLVKSGKILDAQNLVMKAIETQVGGTAAAGVTGSEKMQQAFNQFKESLGLALLPTFNKLADFFTKTLIPKLQDFFKRFQEGKTFLNPVINGIRDFIQFVIDNKDWLAPIAVGIGTVIGLLKVWNGITKLVTFSQLLLDAALSMNPLGAIVLAITAVVAALTFFFTKTETGRKVFKAFGDFVSGVWNGIKSAFQAVVGFISGAWSGLVNGLKTMVMDFANFWIGILNTIIGAVNILLAGLKIVTFGAINVKIPTIPKVGTSTPATGTPKATTQAGQANAAMNAIAGTTFIYNAAPNNSLNAQQELVVAVGKARNKGVGN